MKQKIGAESHLSLPRRVSQQHHRGIAMKENIRHGAVYNSNGASSIYCGHCRALIVEQAMLFLD